VGPPCPLAILYAPAPFSAGMRVTLEVPLHPAGPPPPAPKVEPMPRWSDVYSRLVPVRHADGSLTLDLDGLTIVDARAVRDAHGVHVVEGDASAPASGVER